MRNTIKDSVLLPASPEALFEMYLNPVKHAAITGAPVTIGDEPGNEFQAFDGMLTGIILEVIRPRLIVQSWRSKLFNSDDLDSTLMLCFSQEGEAGRIDLVHLDVPDHDYDDVVKGWEKHYWTSWREYLSKE